MGAVAPTAIRAKRAEHVLEGASPDSAVFREAGHLAAVECDPIADVRASAEYRRKLVAALVPRAVQACLTAQAAYRGTPRGTEQRADYSTI